MSSDAPNALHNLYKILRYWLETSLAPLDAEEAVGTLDELVREGRVNALRAYADELDSRPDRAGYQEMITALRKRATLLNCANPEACTVQDPCFRCGSDI